MARDPAARLTLSPLNPWAFVLGGFGLALAGWLLGATLPDSPGPLRVGLTLAGLAVAGFGVRARLRETAWLFTDRVETAAAVAVTGTAALFGWFSMEGHWESGKMFFGAAFILGLAGTALVVLPAAGRKFFLSLFVLFHFGGMLTAVTSIDPPNAQGPWLSKQLWNRVYRPYLSFLYLTNAYHFYSPDPGPPSLLWFSVQYADGSRTWVKLPERATSAVGMQYQRHLALPEHTVSLMQRLPENEAEVRLRAVRARDEGATFARPSRGTWEEIVKRRRDGSKRLYAASLEIDGTSLEKAVPIPEVWGLGEMVQYREPTEFSKKAVASVARRIFLTAPKKFDAGGDEVPVKSVKMYRIVHLILSPQELAAGVKPLDKTKHMPYFLGEFDAEGKLLDERDPFLYWYLPMLNVPTNYVDYVLLPEALYGPSHSYGVPAGKNTMVLDGLEMHAAGVLENRKGK